MTAHDETDLAFAAMVKKWRRKLGRRNVCALDVLTDIDELWAAVLQSQGRNESEISGKAVALLNHQNQEGS